MDINFNLGDTPKKEEGDTVTESTATPVEDNTEADGSTTMESGLCVFVFISAIPGSTVLINGTKKHDGLKRDVNMIHFAPVGERKPHPIIDSAMYTDFGMYVTDDPKVAWVLNQSIQKGNAQYFAYCPTNEDHVAMFKPEVYAIETPGSVDKVA